MKKFLVLILCVLFVFSLVSCSGQGKKNDYKMSENSKEGSVINSVMTDIAADDEILQKTTASWCDTAVLYEVNIRQYTEEGTFNAFSEHLQRLKDTGINTLWLMPIHPISKEGRKGTLGSYYAVQNYMEVNPEFGTMDDFKALLKKAHDMGFHVILDWVANHTGWDNPWIEEHEDWYVHSKNGEIESPFDWTDTAQLDYTNYEMRYEMIKCMQFWIEEIGVDGFRCDHAIGVPGPFWNAAVYKLKSINSEIMLLAECSPAPALTMYAFDSCYNDNFYQQSLPIKNNITPQSMQEAMKKNTKLEGNSFAMNYLDNHDKNSYNDTIVSNYGDSYAPMLGVIFTMPGMPMIYCSNEDFYDHSLQFFEKDTVKWGEHKYQDLLSALSKIKANNKAIYNATSSEIEFIDVENPEMLLYTRQDENGDNTVYFVGNLSTNKVENAKYSLDLSGAKCVLHYTKDGFTSDEKPYSDSDFNLKNFEPWEYYIFVK